MKIAVPVSNGTLCQHFGHCEQFAILDADPALRQIGRMKLLTPPPHEPGLLPVWLREQGVDVVIAGGMGGRARQIFEQNGVRVVVGAASGAPESLAEAYLEGTLEVGVNACDH